MRDDEKCLMLFLPAIVSEMALSPRSLADVAGWLKQSREGLGKVLEGEALEVAHIVGWLKQRRKVLEGNALEEWKYLIKVAVMGGLGGAEVAYDRM